LIPRKELEGISGAAVNQMTANSAATLRGREDGVNCPGAVSPSVFRQSPFGIFRQDFFDSKTKIKFRFLLVASLRGF
jgi:hypothetical protein